jgi:secreted protein with Ig-like and vWFA domain
MANKTNLNMSSKLPTITLLDSIALIDPSHAGTIVVTGSHGGRSAAGFVVDVSEKPSAVFVNDAGGGKDNAGKVGLDMLQYIGVPAACYSHMSARIGDAQDGLDNGVLTDSNDLAKQAGIKTGMEVLQAIRCVQSL